MKKLLPLFLLLTFLFLPQYAYAGLSEGCFPIVACDPGQDFYGGSCQPHIETLTNCPNPGAPTKFPAFTCDAGCYEKNVSVPSPPPVCPGGVQLNGVCLIKLTVLDDTPDAFSIGNSAFKIWDGANLSEVVHVGTAGCANDEIPVSDSTSATGWKCAAQFGGLWSQTGSDIYFDTGNVGIGTAAPAYKLDVNGTANATQFCLAGSGCISVWPTGEVIWAGVTAASHDGKYANGYADADALCASNYVSSRVCSVEEIMTLRRTGNLPGSVGGDEKAWINGGPPGFNSAANDCAGWKINDTTADNAWGRYWWFGLDQGWADGCNLTHRFACCK